MIPGDVIGLIGMTMMPDGLVLPRTKAIRDVPDNMAERLIVALDVSTVDEARSLVRRLNGVVSFFKIGLGLQFAQGVDGFIDEIIDSGKKVFLDAKVYDIPETVQRAVTVAASRNVSFITVHGDEEIMKAAVDGRGTSNIKVFAVTVLTSLDDKALHELGYRVGAQELVEMRAKKAVTCGCNGIIASANDKPNSLRLLANMADLLIATPGIRLFGSDAHDQKRVTTPKDAIENGADYLVVGRSIILDTDPVAAARRFIDEMEAAKPT